MVNIKISHYVEHNLSNKDYDTIKDLLYTNFTSKIYGQKKWWQNGGKILEKVLKNTN